MLKARLALGLLLVILAGHAQVNCAWCPAQPGSQLNYKADTSALPLNVVIKIDSVFNGRYYLNRIVKPCDTCHNSTLLNDYLDSTYVLAHQPQFLGRWFTSLPGNAFYCKGLSGFVLRPHNAVGANWLFDSTQNISASIILKTQQSIFGSLDSVCSMALSNNDTLLLSKSFGIVHFPFKTTTTHHYVLAGVEGPANAGVQLKRFHDFFDWNVGDAFQYAFEEDDYNNFPPSFNRGAERWDVLSATIYNDSACYSIRKTHVDSSWIGAGIPISSYYTSTVNVSFVDSATHPANAYPLQQMMANPYFAINNGIYSIHRVVMGLDSRQKITKSFGQGCPSIFLSGSMTGAACQTPFSDVYLNRNSSKIIGREMAEGLGFTSELFNNYDQIHQRCLIGYIKGSDTSGTIYSATTVGIRNLSNANPYVIYPSPASDVVTIKGALAAGTTITLINQLGQSLQSITVSGTHNIYQLPVSAFDNGLYFIVISGPQTNTVKKLIIRHQL